MTNKLTKKLIFVVLLIGISIFTLSCKKEVKTDLTPGEHVSLAMMNTIHGSGMDISAVIDFEMDYNEVSKLNEMDGITEEMVDMINKLSLQANYKMKTDLANKVFDFLMQYDINYNKSPLLSLEMILNNDLFGFGVTNLFEKYFIIDFKSIMDQVDLDTQEMAFYEIDFSRYLAIMTDQESETYKKIQENDAYKTVLNSYLDKSLSKGVNEEVEFTLNGKTSTENVLTYEFKLDLESYFDFLVELLKTAESDEDLKAYVKEVATKLVDELITSKDYEVFDLYEEDVLMMQTAIETEFDGAWDEFFSVFNEMVKEMDATDFMSREEMTTLSELYDAMVYKISVNSEDMIKKVSISMAYNGIQVDTNYTMNGFGDDVVIEQSEDDFVNLMDFIDLNNPDTIKNTEGFATLVKDVIVSGINEIIDGQGFKDLFKDLEAFEDELGMDMASIPTYLEMARVYIQAMSTEEIVAIIEDSMSSTLDDGYDSDYYDDYTSALNELDAVTYLVTEEKSTLSNSSEIYNAIDVLSQVYGIASEALVTNADSFETDLYQAIDRGSDIIFMSGTFDDEIVVDVVELFPQVQFVLLDSYNDYYADNLSMIEYYNEETAYVAGYLAAMLTESNMVGFVGGLQDAETTNYEIAYTSGVASVNENIEVVVEYADSITDVAYGLSIAENMNSVGVDVLYLVAEEVGNAVMDASEDYGFKIIGNGSMYGESLPGFITATLRDYNLIIDRIIDDYNYGYVSSYYSYGIYEDALYIPNDHIPEDLIESKNELVDMIDSGELFIPAN